jgi:hypothetical protein
VRAHCQHRERDECASKERKSAQSWSAGRWTLDVGRWRLDVLIKRLQAREETSNVQRPTLNVQRGADHSTHHRW